MCSRLQAAWYCLHGWPVAHNIRIVNGALDFREAGPKSFAHRVAITYDGSVTSDLPGWGDGIRVAGKDLIADDSVQVRMAIAAGLRHAQAHGGGYVETLLRLPESTGMMYTPAQREQISAQAAGKTVISLEYEDSPDAGYWVMTFSDGSEIAFRFMAEIVR